MARESRAPRDGKEALRRRIWSLLEEEGVGRFPGVEGRIPNFEGAGACAERLDRIPAWAEARVLKCNPDYAQVAVRSRAFEEGKILYLAVPRLRDEKCFLELDPKQIDASPRKAVTIKGAARLGRPVHPGDVRPVDLVVCGSVAVHPSGIRVGKGGGYSDLEYALGREAGFLDEDTPVLTTVHELQVVRDPPPRRDHDVPLDWIVTPERILETRTELPRPAGILPDRLDAEDREAIPALRQVLRDKDEDGNGEAD